MMRRSRSIDINMKKYITFNIVELKTKTKVYGVFTSLRSLSNKSKGNVLGIIKWYSLWRQYCFFPDANTIYSQDCLRDIVNFIKKLMKERKES